MSRHLWRWTVGLLLIFWLGPFSSALLALAPDQLVLIVNSNVPASKRLAQFYAQQRGIPDGRILELALPFPQEEMPFEMYDAQVAPKVRAFLLDNHLERKVTCLVTFYGVPLRIARMPSTPADAAALADLRREAESARKELESAVANAEQLSSELDPTFKRIEGGNLDQLFRRAATAVNTAVSAIAKLPDPDKQKASFNRFVEVYGQLSGRARTMELRAGPQLSKLDPQPPSKAQLSEARKTLRETQQAIAELESHLQDAKSRQRMLSLARANLGLMDYAPRVAALAFFLEATETESALDSELALLWQWPYPRHRWQPNPLYFRTRSAGRRPPTLMVMRLDGPQEGSARDIIASSMKAEREGLRGRVVLDARGRPVSDPYGFYDQGIRNLARIVHQHTQLPLTFDEKETVFGPGSVKDVAIYCGWYSLRNYVPSFTFANGAVGFHVASLELVSLRTPGEKGWVAGLLNDGVVGTLGAVAEPYLQSFPPADEFFPLLLTGKLSLAEVYWRTTPFASWMLTCIGDPLYTPFRTNPALKVEDLPPALRSLIPSPASTQPAQPTQPSTLPAH